MARCAIIGAGISGLSAAYYLRKLQPDTSIDLWEAADRPGGVIRTESIEGCIADGGPDSYLSIKTAATDLCREVGLSDSLMGSHDAGRKTFIYDAGQLKELPAGLFFMLPSRIGPFVRTSLLSWPGKLAALDDLFALPETQDTTVADFVERRFGPEILQKLAEPLLSGVYGGDVKNLSMQNALPPIWELQKKGSLIRQIRKIPRSTSASLFTTIVDGMYSLPNALARSLENVRWHYSSSVGEVIREDSGWRIGSESYDAVVVAASRPPVIRSAAGAAIGTILGSIRRNSAIVVVLVFRGPGPSGFGWLVPAIERRSVLACTYVNNKFPGRCAADRFAVRLFFGGKQADRWIEEPEDNILREGLNELSRIAGIRDEPLAGRVFRWPASMPEYAVGHSEKIRKLQEAAASERNLFFTGNLFYGVGMPDCIRHARDTAAAVSARLDE